MWLLGVILASLLRGPLAAGGITEDERLLVSDGAWHRNQRKSVSIESSCYYTTMEAMPYGCQYARAHFPSYQNEYQRKSEKAALMEFYNLCGGDFWRSRDNWNQDLDPCWDYWYGVTCNEHGYVIKLELSDNRVRGMLPSTMGALTSLIKLDLSSTESDYHLHPNEEMNRVEGVMPSLAMCFQLEEIEVSGNLILRLPDDLYLNADTLRSLSASRNLLKNLPIYLSRYQLLHTLELDNNRIEDEFPAEFGRLQNIRFVHLQYNRLIGSITRDIVPMNKIRVFDVSHNPGLSGVIPEQIIVDWAYVDYLAILNTSIAGYISSLCLDVPFCWKFMYDTHKDLTWATVSDVPDIVGMTVELAQTQLFAESGMR
ncbi:unnamed protein product [Effrenium voratum]|nr:unnamed protein product [Effrenium voratum]CAJ1406220.1 unnamed protein product [Effrenium voratum]CAJ1438232.1 unnamed protein product [Effrenium voratum]